MKKLGLTLLAAALSAPFTFAKAPAQNTSSQPTTQGKTSKHRVKHQKKHKTKTTQSNSGQPTVK